MAKAERPKTRTPRDDNRKDRDSKEITPEKPPESAEDFAHVLRRLMPVRKKGAEKG